MKLLLEVTDSKASHVLEVLKGMRYVKTTKVSSGKVRLIKQIKSAVEEMKIIRAGKKEAQNAACFLKEL